MTLRWADPRAPIEWGTSASLEVVVPAPGFDAPSAIYTAGSEYQRAPVDTLHFALCGRYGVSDHEVWYVSIDLDGG